jgi:hypothetical protein
VKFGPSGEHINRTPSHLPHPENTDGRGVQVKFGPSGEHINRTSSHLPHPENTDGGGELLHLPNTSDSTKDVGQEGTDGGGVHRESAL